VSQTTVAAFKSDQVWRIYSMDGDTVNMETTLKFTPFSCRPQATVK